MQVGTTAYINGTINVKRYWALGKSSLSLVSPPLNFARVRRGRLNGYTSAGGIVMRTGLRYNASSIERHCTVDGTITIMED